MEDAIELSTELATLTKENIDINQMKSYSKLLSFTFIFFSKQCQTKIFSSFE